MEPILSGDLAHRLGGEVDGETQRRIRGVGTLQDAGPDDVSWLAHPRLLGELVRSRAGVVLIPRQLGRSHAERSGSDRPSARTATAATTGAAGTTGGTAAAAGHAEAEVDAVVLHGDASRTFIRVDDPELAICEVLRWLMPPPPQVSPGVHPAALIDPTATVAGAAIAAGVFVGPGAVIGPGTQLHPGVYVGAGVRIGRDCVLWPNVVIREGVTLGDRVTVHPNATIGADGFGYLLRHGEHVKIPQIGGVQIEDDVEIGANACIDRARSGLTRIGRGTKIDNLVQIGHNSTIGRHCILVGQAGVSGSCVLGDYVTLAGQAGVADHVHLGDRSAVTAKSGVAGDVAAGQVVRGTPARDVATFNRAYAALLRLPRLMEQVRELARRLQELESATNDPARK